MSPVPTSNFPAIGYNSQLGIGSTYDPVAARKSDRPKFNLDDYDVKEKREAEPRHASNHRKELEDTHNERRSDIERSKVAHSADKNEAVASGNMASAKTDGVNTLHSDFDQSNDTQFNADNAAEDTSAAFAVTNTQNEELSSGASAIAEPQANAEVLDPEASNASTSKEMIASAAAATAAAAAATTRTGVATTDPKLAALEKLTKIEQRRAATAPGQASGEDTTTYKLPVPWPPVAQSEPTRNGKSGQTSTAHQAAQAQANQAATISEQAQSIIASTKESLEKKSGEQSALSSAAKTTGAADQKIEVVNQPQSKAASTSESLLFANNRAAPSDGQAKATALPSPGDTIAAATALNSRAAQSNALVGSHVKQSNAASASTESNGNKASTNLAQQNPAIISQTAQTPPTATAFTAATPVQSTVTTPEQVAAARQQAAAIPSGPIGQSETASRPSRLTDHAAQGTGSGFADTLRTTSSERTAASPDRQNLPTPAAEQVKVKLVKAVQGGLDKIKIQLNPSELGKVEVRLEIGSDGAIRGTVIADKPETMELLQRDAKQLERALQDAGFKTGGDSLDFQMRGGGTNERQQQQAGSGNGPLSRDGGDLEGSSEQSATETSGTEHDGIGDDGSLNLVA